MSISDVKSSGRWLRGREATGPCRTLVCMPHAGGTAQAYRGWQRALPADIAVRAVQYPGRQDRLGEAFADSIDELVQPLADALAPLVASPLALFGHSMGAIVAYELTVELERRHGAVVDLLVVSGSKAPTDRDANAQHTLDDAGLTAEIVRVNQSFAELSHSSELLDLVLPAVRADYRLVGAYHRDAVMPVQAPIVAFGGDTDPDVSRFQLAAWRDFTRAGFQLRMFPGDHFYLMDEHVVLPALSRLLPMSASLW